MAKKRNQSRLSQLPIPKGTGTRTTKDPIDTGTNDLHKRHATRVERRASGGVHVRVLNGNQIDRLLWAETITPEQHSILVGFQLRLHRASLLTLRAATLEARISGAAHKITDVEAELRVEINKDLHKISRKLGKAAVDELLALCLDDRPPRSIARIIQVIVVLDGG